MHTQSHADRLAGTDITFITNEEEKILRDRFQVLIQEPRCTAGTWKGPIKDSEMVIDNQMPWV